MSNDFSLNDITRCLTQAEASEAKGYEAKGYSLSKIARHCNLLGKVPALASYLGYTQEQVSTLLGGECITTPKVYFSSIHRDSRAMKSLHPKLTADSPLPLAYLRQVVPAAELFLANEPPKTDPSTYTPYATNSPHDYDRGDHATKSLNRAFELRTSNSGKGGGIDYTPYSGDQSLYFTGGLR